MTRYEHPSPADGTMVVNDQRAAKPDATELALQFNPGDRLTPARRVKLNFHFRTGMLCPCPQPYSRRRTPARPLNGRAGSFDCSPTSQKTSAAPTVMGGTQRQNRA
jgi:hypothetical protein